MSVVSKVLDFLFGKDPAIFNEKGEVDHKLPNKTWDNWQNKNRSNPEYNWKNHSGTKPSK